MKRRYTFWGMVIALAAFHAVILLAGFFAPYSYSQQNRMFPYAPPSRIHFFDSRGHFHLRPFVYGLRHATSYGSYVTDTSVLYPVHFLVSGSHYKIADLIPSSTHCFGVAQPGFSAGFPFCSLQATTQHLQPMHFPMSK